MVSTPPLALTGERTGPGSWHETYWLRRHEVAYAACRTLASTPPDLVLDAGSGEGYGPAMLAGTWPGAHVVGVDYDGAATAHAAAAHGGGRTAYVRGGLTPIPLQDDVIDLTVSLQVIEHIWTPGDYVRELARVTRPEGVVVLSTPNRPTFSPGLGRRERPANPFHCREYDADELATAIGAWSPTLRVVELLGVHHGDRLRAWEESHGSIVAGQQAGPPETWSRSLRDAVAEVAATDFVIGPTDLEEALDLVVVARRVPVLGHTGHS